MKAGRPSCRALMSLQEWAHLRERYDDEEGPVDALVLHEVCDERDGLDGLSQTHLVGQDAVQVVVVQGHQPLQTLDLQAQRWPALKPGWVRERSPYFRDSCTPATNCPRPASSSILL